MNEVTKYTGVHVEIVALEQSLGGGPQHGGAESTGTLDAAQETAAAPDDELHDDERNDQQPAIIEQHLLGECLRQSSRVLFHRLRASDSS